MYRQDDQGHVRTQYRLREGDPRDPVRTQEFRLHGKYVTDRTEIKINIHLSVTREEQGGRDKHKIVFKVFYDETNTIVFIDDTHKALKNVHTFTNQTFHHGHKL